MNNIAIVTGGTGSIGAAIAAEFQARGQSVVVADLDEQPVPAGQHFVRCDVTDPASVAALFERAKALGKITTVAAAHGFLLETPVGEADPADVARVIDVNLKGSALLCDAAAKHLEDGASIVMIGSVSAFLGRVSGSYAYQATKAGIESMTRVYAVAYGPRSIRVNCVAPGVMEQPMKGKGIVLRARQGGNEKMRALTPLRRLVTGLDLAKAVAFLTSDDALSITGIVLPVDAGQLAF